MCVAFAHLIPSGCKQFCLFILTCSQGRTDRTGFVSLTFIFFVQCSNGGGQWFRTPCISLHRCIDARPRKDEDGYSQPFEDFVVDNELEIFDYTDSEQCQTARVALGFDGDHPDDDEVCGQFDNTLCENRIRFSSLSFCNSLPAHQSSGDLFFRDLEFLAEVANGGEVKFEQVVYTPIE